MMAAISIVGFYFWRLLLLAPLQEKEGCQLHHSCTAGKRPVISIIWKRIHFKEAVA
jgi:hypothetical protein